MADSGFPWAVKTGDLKGVKEAVEGGEDVNQVGQDTNKRTPMHWAADYGQVEVMKYLVSKGAKPDVKDNFGITPLLAATYEGHAGAVEYLLTLDVDLNVKGPDDMTPVEAADKPEIKDMLQAASAGGGSTPSAPAPAESEPASGEVEEKKKFDRPSRPAPSKGKKKRFGIFRK